jgi:hypothetical protein
MSTEPVPVQVVGLVGVIVAATDKPVIVCVPKLTVEL